jgi:DNA-binding transcriptional regulator YiaG
MTPITGPGVHQLRREMKLNQTEFWGRFGVAQSVGSRYETGKRHMDAPLRRLIYLLHFTSVEAYLSESEVRQLEAIK